MLIQCLSDIHLEFMDDNQIHKFLKSLKGEADILVIAGDIAPVVPCVKIWEKLLKVASDKYKNVIFVTGNHEYYKSSFIETHKLLNRLITPYDNIHWLNNYMVIIDNQRFIGGTGWFPRLLDTMPWHKRLMNDFEYIENLDPEAYESNNELESFLVTHLEKDDILVLHHLPHELSVAPKWKGQETNRFFRTDFDWIIEQFQPKLVLHGHGHTKMDYMIGDTHIVANPKAYPFEYNKYFDPNLIIEI